MKLKKFIVLGLSTLSIMNILTGCYSKLQNNLNDTVLDKINKIEATNSENSVAYNKFSFTGADFTEIGNKYEIDISGIATKSDKNSVKYYINLEYEVDSLLFKDVSKNSAEKLLKTLDYIVQNYEIKNYSNIAVNSAQKFNSVMHSNLQNKEEDYSLVKSFTYAINDIKIDEKNGVVSFITRQNVKYEKVVVEKQPYTNGYICFALDKEVVYDAYRNQSYKIDIKATPEEIAEMKKDNSKIINKFIDVVDNNKHNQYSVKQIYNLEHKLFNDAKMLNVQQESDRNLN